MESNNQNQLPPELVEKMRTAMNEMSTPSDLAQIAVDYSVRENWDMTCALEGANDIIKGLRQQRDELLEALRESQLQLEYLSKKFGETGSGNSVISRNNVIIKKYEDGKE